MPTSIRPEPYGREPSSDARNIDHAALGPLEQVHVGLDHVDRAVVIDLHITANLLSARHLHHEAVHQPRVINQTTARGMIQQKKWDAKKQIVNEPGRV